MYEYLSNRIKEFSNFVLIREQTYSSEALRYDGGQFYYYSLHDRGMGIEVIDKNDNIVFFHTNMLDQSIINILNEMNKLDKTSISPLNIKGIYKFYKNRKVITTKIIKNKSTWYAIDSYKELLKERYNELKNLYRAYNLEVYLLLSEEQFKIQDNIGTNVVFNNICSSIRNSYNININSKKYFRQISCSGNDIEVLTSKNNINKFNEDFKRHNSLNTKLYNAELVTDLGSKYYDKILFNYEFISVVIHEIIGHLIEEDNYNKYTKTNDILAHIDKLNKRLNLSIHDRPNINSWGYQPFDCNGNIRTEYDSISFKLLNTVYNKNWSEKIIFSDRIEKYSSFPLPRMSNMTLEMLPEYILDIEKDATESEILDLLLKKELISYDNRTLVLTGCINGYINKGKMEFYCLPEHSYIFQDGRYLNIGQKYVSFNIIDFFDSIIFGIGELKNNYYNYCKKKGQQIQVSGGSNEYILSENLNVNIVNS